MAQAQGELEKEIDTEQARFEKVKGNHDDLELKFKTARREHANATKSLLKIENECKAAEKVYKEVVLYFQTYFASCRNLNQLDCRSS